MKQIRKYIIPIIIGIFVCSMCVTAGKIGVATSETMSLCGESEQRYNKNTQQAPIRKTIRKKSLNDTTKQNFKVADVIVDSISKVVKNEGDTVSLNQYISNDTLKIVDDVNVADSIMDLITKENEDTAVTPIAKSKFVKSMVDLDNIVHFTSKDSMILYGKNNATMYGSGDITYGQINLKAQKISMEINKNEVYAMGLPDSSGEVQGLPVYKDQSGEYNSKTMRYNFKTKRGYITDIITQQGEGYLTGGITKKVDDDEYYIQNGRYTTCDDHDDPHFFFRITKGKVKAKKNIVTGPAYMVLEGVPLPIAVPFGYFPFSTKYSSGIIFPTFGEDYNYGFYMKDGGYYFAINNNIDMALTGQIYSRGSWGLTLQSNYVKRYRFSGGVNISYLENVMGEKGEPNYGKAKNFKIAWQHTQDPKANPSLTFSASVNFATSGYSRNNLDSYYSKEFTENTKSSTINLSYKRPNSKWSFSLSASVSQRTQDSTLSVSFPNLNISMSQTAPFKRKKAVGAERWYEKIKLSYTGTFQNALTAKQNVFFKKSLIKDWKNAMRHQVPIQATFSLFKYINVTPSVTLTDRMYTNKVRRSWNPAASAEMMDTVYGFYNVFDFSASVSANTKVYGFFKPMKFLGDKVQMIRHVLTPTISYTGAPDFSSPGWGYYGTYAYIGVNGQMQYKKYSYFQGAAYGTAPMGKTSAISVSLANNLEMKVRDDKDSTGVKKVSLIENFTISQSYNFAADSLKWSNIQTSVMLRLVKNFNLNLSATWDPYTYQLNEFGNPVRVNKTRLQAGKGWAKLSSTGTSFSYTFNNATFKKKDKNQDKKKNKTDEGKNQSNNKDGFGHKHDDVGEVSDDGYTKWEVPWSFTINYSVNYSYGTFNYEKMDYNGKITQNLSFNGNIKPTKNWSFSFSSSFNFETKKINYMNCTISRDLHCFTMSASFIPIGPYKSYNFHIAVKSSLLSDLKYDKRSSSANGVNWY